MSTYLISFPGPAMRVDPEDLPQVSADADAATREARDAGVLVFAGGIDNAVGPVMVAADGTVTEGTYPQTREFDGGFTVVDVESREEALRWAARFARACRCPQEVREIR
ncbi:transcription initiation protein [Tessaracoccus aquimaris]|uniref:Transcription initiation protein n=1 Tax=Tessaracoccus aquimaris TaxID=1332264 RepID=A0A1Q2CP87_9ACTN|nr:YciI family protein [Tessaracoccus aquimaris]AQP47895.1 transcription initiation protein [Tessaracoccus aquimaris]